MENDRGVSEETDSNLSVISASLASPLQNNFSLCSGTEKHQRAHSARNKETTEDDAASEDRDQTLKGHLHTGKLPRRPKTTNPKRVSPNNTQSSSPAASSPRTVIRPKQDSNIQMASTASSGPGTNSRNNSTEKSKDTLILDVESGEQITISTCTGTRPPKISHGEQKHVENRTDFAENLKKKNSTAQPSKSKHTEEMDLDEAIEEILGISTLGDEQAAEPNSMSQERNTNSRKKVTGQSHGMDTKKPTVQTISVQDIGSSSVETMNCDSECSVASGDNMRPMAAGSSRGKTSGGSASSKSKQTLPAILLKDETIVQKPHMRASRETAEPSLGGLQGMETHRNAAVPVTSGNKSGISSGIFYEPEELELMKQIEREFPCSLQGMETHRNATVPVTSGNRSAISPGIFYEPEELELMKQIEREFPCC